MNILNQPINPGGHPVFPAAKESGHLMPASVRFDGVPAPQPSTAAVGRPRWQAQTLRRASSYVGAEHDGTTASSVPVPVPVPGAALAPVPFKPITLDFLRSLVDTNCSMTPVAPDAEATAPPPPQMVALRVVVTSAVELDARQTELIARKMHRLTGFVNLKGFFFSRSGHSPVFH
uniref:ATP synthase_truncated n=1 Tax=Saccharum hybrid cultivar R570 TaxID=131158 RepID=A0A0A1I5G1_9POAL|nr:ATP synthase_truncated [Saccharum hybrid cultivar R570]